MIKDRAQKKLAVKFCAAQGILPFMEVVVRSHSGLEEAPVNITDIDVLGLDLGRSGAVQRVLFDCKTGSKLSAINRALWAGGLMTFVRADRAYVIQKKEAPYSHKLAANVLDVHIHSEETFVRYANSITLDFSRDISYLDNLDIWDCFVALGQVQPALGEAVWFATTQAALEASGPRGIRLGLSALIKAAPELDPRRSAHRLLFGGLVSGFLIFLSLSANALKEIFQFSMDKEDFERTVRYFVWEGRENYLNRRNMKAAIDKAKGDSTAAEFDLPEWHRFVQLVRFFLDAPEALSSLPLLTKEIAFRASAGAVRKDADEHIRRLFQMNNRARQFIFATATYLVHAARLPREFEALLESDVNVLVTDAAAVSGRAAAAGTV
jgi:hypothetical protein